MNKIIFICLLCLSSNFCRAQNYDIGIQLGLSMYSGDVDAPGFFTNFQNLRPAIGVIWRYHFNDYLALRSNYSRLSLTGSDSKSDVEWQILRNLSFDNTIHEFSFSIENTFFGFGTNANSNWFSPYVFAGVAVYTHNPTTEYNGQRYELQSLGTEGQGLPGFSEKYSLTELAIPMGGGLKYRLSDKWSIAGEMNIRFLFTDYIDDVSTSYVNYTELMSGNGFIAATLANRTNEVTGDTEPVLVATGAQRGKSEISDYFMSGVITISYHFNSIGNFGGGGIDSGCPMQF